MPNTMHMSHVSTIMYDVTLANVILNFEMGNVHLALTNMAYAMCIVASGN